MIRGLSTETNARIRKTSLTRENGIDYSKRSLTRFMQSLFSPALPRSSRSEKKSSAHRMAKLLIIKFEEI